MKGYCQMCGKVIDEVEINKLICCIDCYEGNKGGKERKETFKRVKALCDILEIDHVGLIQEGIKRLMDKWNRLK